MKSFICLIRPRSVNAKGTATYKMLIQDAYNKDCYKSIIATPAYAHIYLFRTVPHQLDADNSSKPILDALTGLAYNDDSIIELR